jgi:predicted thioesterase
VLESFDGKFYNLKVKATEGGREIGVGTIQRAIVSMNKFLDKFEIPRP